jgi:heterodisulfide reductase subunit B
MTEQDKTKLWNMINEKRKEIGEAYDAEGNTEKVLALSWELDELLNQYDRIIRDDSTE